MPISRYVYVASSWRNPIHATVIQILRAANISCYDFKTDEGAAFHWSEVSVNSNGENIKEYLEGIKHPRAQEGFNSDLSALQKADTCILILPCGRSSHLELGWAVGQGKRTAILLDDREPVIPELMYKMVDYIAPSLYNLLTWLGVV